LPTRGGTAGFAPVDFFEESVDMESP
jgi:hypothetical protein